MQKKFWFLLASLVWLSSLHAFAQSVTVDSLGLVPLPLNVNVSAGEFTLPSSVTISATSADEKNVASFLSKYIKFLGDSSSVSSGNTANIQLVSTEKSIAHPEGYQLTVDNNGIKVNASTGAGLFYGVQTLIQMLPVEKKGEIKVPFITIKDQPAFKWRGVMLDVSRHFFPVSFVKEFIDQLATYKINTFHWHLTDDQGWRIEIKKYPKLTQISSTRKESLIGAQQLLRNQKKEFTYDGIPHGGFYTQEEVKDVVAYAQKRYITIVPEIEMPGHSVSVLAAYPELACKPGNYEVRTKWGISEDIVCPSEQTFQFFENVLSEVVQLFPGKYVHIGGDEAPKDVWKESPEVAKIMKKNKLKDVEQVQGWFNARIEKFLQSKGKKLVGWDEILEAGITPSSTVMSWRGEKGGIEAARHGNEVVMTPTTYVYFDYGQNPIPHNPLEPLMISGYLPLEKVYSYKPLSEELTSEQHKYILGVQANLWTEYITTPNKVEYMMYPRMLALSEIAWTPFEKKDFESFEARLSRQFPRLDAMDIHYRVPHPTGLDSASIVTQGDKAIITLKSIVPGAEIRYTLDGHIPDQTTELYTKPLEIPLNRKIKVMAVTITPEGRHSVPVELQLP